MQFRPSLPRIIALSLVAFGLMFTSAGPVNADHDTTYITFEGGGFGHGVGMSQFGALGRAEAGHSAAEILAFYFNGTTVENRGGELEEFLGEGIRVRLSPAYQSFDRPDGVTVTARDGALLTVRFNEDNVHTANSIYLEQAGQIGGSSNGVTEADDEWYWILKLDGSDEDVCVGCIASSATIERPDGAIIDIVDDVGSQGAHDAGDLTLVGRDTAAGSTPDTVFVVLQLPLEDYLQGIDEVPPDWPDEALQAQAIAARSYAVAQAIDRRNGLMLDDPAYDGWTFDVFDSVQDQVYDGYEDRNGNAIEYESRLAATLATAGQVVVYDDTIVRTFYSSSNGSYTAASEDSFDDPEPFHIAKPDPFDAALDVDGNPQNPFPFRQFSYTREALSRWFARDNFGVGIVQSVTFNNPVPSGRVNDITATIVGADYPNGRVVSASRVRWAIVNGCQEDAADPGIDFECEDYPRSSHLRLAQPIVTAEPDTTRLAGDNRYETAAAIAMAPHWDDEFGCIDVSVVSGENFPDGLTAAAYGDRIVLVRQDSIPAATQQALEHLMAIEECGGVSIRVIGGTGVISSNVFDALDAMTNGEVVRFAGADRYETALAVAGDVCECPNIILATGENFPDALAAGPLAIFTNGAIVLNKGESLRPDVKSFIANEDPVKVWIVGGTGVVPASVEAELRDMGLSVARLAGNNRFSTAAAIADRLAADVGLGYSAVLVNGNGFADALAAGPFAALDAVYGSIMLVNIDSIPPATAAWHVANCDTLGRDTTKDIDVDFEAGPNGEVSIFGNVYAIGGTSVVSDAVLEGAAATAKCGSP